MNIHTFPSGALISFFLSTLPLPAFALSPIAAGSGAITLYEDTNLSGRALTFSQGSEFLGHQDFNDRVSSVQIHAGVWQLCEDAYLGGNCRQVGPGSYRNTTFIGIGNDQLSSIQLVTTSQPTAPPILINPPANPASGSVTLFDDTNFGGGFLNLSGSSGNLQNQGFNDITSSVRIRAGTWQLCEDVNYQGRCAQVNPGNYSNMQRLGLANDSLSSLRPVASTLPAPAPASPIIVYPNRPSRPVYPESSRDDWGRDQFGCLPGYYRSGGYCIRY
jgi:hypothetical protein